MVFFRRIDNDCSLERSNSFPSYIVATKYVFFAIHSILKTSFSLLQIFAYVVVVQFGWNHADASFLFIGIVCRSYCRRFLLIELSRKVWPLRDKVFCGTVFCSTMFYGTTFCEMVFTIGLDEMDGLARTEERVWKGKREWEREREIITISVKKLEYVFMNFLPIRKLLSMCVLNVSLLHWRHCRKTLTLILEALSDGLVSVKAAKISCTDMCEHPGHAINATFRLAIDQRFAIVSFQLIEIFC